MYYDFHSHLNMYDNVENITKEIEKNKIYTISASIDKNSYLINKKISALSNLILPVFGIHPSQAYLYADRLSEIDMYIEESPLIGEIGLDYLWVDPININAQKKVFRYLSQKAVEQDKFMIIHTKDAESDILEILTDIRAKKVIIHWYSGSEKIFNEYSKLGWYFTFGVETKKSKNIHNLLDLTPPDKILAETDSPVGIEWLYRRMGKPSDIIDVYNTLADLMGMTNNDLKNLISTNSSKILNDVRNNTVSNF